MENNLPSFKKLNTLPLSSFIMKNELVFLFSTQTNLSCGCQLLYMLRMHLFSIQLFLLYLEIKNSTSEI